MTSNEDEVVQLQEFCGVGRQQAVALLTKFKTLEAAANAFFTDPVGALKDEPAQNEWMQADNLPAFQIETEDSIRMPSMSRPPSRIDNRANVEAAVGQQFVHQQYSQDNDLQRAIDLSKQQPSQDSGVTLTDQRFGPATRSHYDPNQWAVTAFASSREIIDHPRPSKRRRVAGQPAFLRGSPATGYLAPLLNIYYHIPLARQAFLFPSLRVHSYGFDPQWWSGMSDENTKSLSVESSHSYDTQGQIFLAELQCLMAFLNGTDRAYGSIDALWDLDAFKSFVTDTASSRFIESWIAAGIRHNPSEQLTQIFTSEARKASQEPHLDYDRNNFLVLDAPVENSTSSTLVDLMDNIIWNDLVDDVDEIWMERCAQVFTMRLHRPPQPGTDLGLEIPAIWYPERYMLASKDAAFKMRLEISQLKRELQKCDYMQRRCSIAKSADKRTIKIRDVLEAAARISGEMDSPVSPSGNDQPASQSSQVNTQLQSVLTQLDQKVELLERQKKILREDMVNLSRSFTHSNNSNSEAGRIKYVLQGVATKPNITYIRVRANTSADLTDVSISLADDAKWQWWRIEWHGEHPRKSNMQGPQTQAEAMALDEASHPYTICEISEEDVLQAAQHENDSAVLVYADQQAIEFADPKISAPLKEFVRHDNRAFQNELEEESGVAPRPYSQNTNTTIMDENWSDNEDIYPPSRRMTSMSTKSSQREPKEGILHSEDEQSETYKAGQHLEERPDTNMDSTTNRAMQPAVSKVGILADQMLEKYTSDGPVHIEHPTEPLR